ncbi:hypothetical protein [Candidatus Uabimicrobium sp. HlEnr_7]|uniref:hypothetical protein n=1 Tax=Candidatus Uabimicrobium helgolandensis TaxID=3095367 RepID=UPI00355720AC
MAMYGKYNDEIDVEITVKRTDLIERLQSNCKKHKKEFDEAISFWQKELATTVSKIKAEECFSYPAELTELWEECPISYEKEYERVIDMFNMCVKNEIKLDSQSFNTFCRDEWEWKSKILKNKFYKKITVVL